MKRLGLEGEQVCEIGRWKNVQAFTSHYQRLGSHEVLQRNLVTALDGVHSGTSPRPGWSAGGVQQLGGA